MANTRTLHDAVFPKWVRDNRKFSQSVEEDLAIIERHQKAFGKRNGLHVRLYHAVARTGATIEWLASCKDADLKYIGNFSKKTRDLAREIAGSK